MGSTASGRVSVILGIAWCVIAFMKIVLPDQQAYSRAAFRTGIHTDTVRVLFLSLALIELCVGIALIRPRRVRAGAQASLLPAAVFFVYAAWAGSDTSSCGCLGSAVHLAGMPRFGVALALFAASYFVVRSTLAPRH